jgi:hypothetical protein
VVGFADRAFTGCAISEYAIPTITYQRAAQIRPCYKNADMPIEAPVA